VLVLISVIIGGLAEIVPMAIVRTNIPTIPSVHPYTPLELEGRDIYVREGCYNCHSQMVRPLRDEVIRYGEYSKAGEFVYDHPFQFGSKRTGPDLHRLGGKYPHFWHYRHMLEPVSTSPGSIMPPYPWLYTQEIDTKTISKKLKVMQKLGVPYTDSEVETAEHRMREQAKALTLELIGQGASGNDGLENKEIIAMIAYLQRLGTDIKGK
jgi:cytochrome c oxidase cbb3-type subunit I/II